MATKERILTRPERLEHLKSYFLRKLAENSLDETNFDGHVIDTIEDLEKQYPDDEAIKPEMRVWVNDSKEADSLVDNLKTKYYVKRAWRNSIIPVVAQGNHLRTGYAEIRNFFLHS